MFNSHTLACVYVFLFRAKWNPVRYVVFFIMFEQAVSSSLHELGLVSLKKEQRQAVEAIVNYSGWQIVYYMITHIKYSLKYRAKLAFIYLCKSRKFQ